MKKKIFAVFSVFFLWLISSAAWAADFTNNTAMNNHHDLSMAFLGQVFGSVGNVLQGTSGQMLGHLFYKLNEGIIIVAGLWLGYTVFTIVLRAAQEGSFMGANKNVAMTFLKIAVGFSLLIPNPGTGYSLLQDIVMKVVVQGVGLADQTWQYGLKYIDNGGSVWRRPSTEDSASAFDQGGTSIITNSTTQSILGQSNKTGPGQQIFADEVCLYSSNDNQPTGPVSNSNMGPAVNSSPSVQYDVVTDDVNHLFQFPGVGNAAPVGPGSNNCGQVSWDIQNACTGTGSSDDKCAMAKQAVSSLVMNLLPAAKQYYCNLHSNAASCLGVGTENTATDDEEVFFNGLVNYVNLVDPLVQLNTSGAGTTTNFINEAENEGWLSAGRYYWDLAQVQSQYDQISNVGNYAPASPAGPTLSGQPLSDASNALSEAQTYIGPVEATIAQWSQSETSGDTGSGFQAYGGSAGFGFMASILGGVVGDVVNLITSFTTAGNGGFMGPDPIMFLHRVGMDCIALAGDIWLGSLGLIAGVMLAAGVCNSEYAAWPAMQSVVDWVKPLLIVLATAFWGIGFVLGFYVPMYPYIIYTFGVIGWVIAVIEAMVAAPLVCFGLTHPEGHDFLGEAKQALMLLLSVFLRPVLMVIGLIAAMILSYVSLRIIVYTFSGFASDLFYQPAMGMAPASGPASGNILAAAGNLMGNAMMDSWSISGFILCLFVFPLTLIIFTTLVYTVTTQCFSLIFALPDNIMRWIGGPTHASQSAQMAQQIQSAIGGSANTTGRGSEGISNASDARAREERQSQLARPASQNAQAGNAGSSASSGSGGKPKPSLGQKAFSALGFRPFK